MEFVKKKFYKNVTFNKDVWYCSLLFAGERERERGWRTKITTWEGTKFCQSPKWRPTLDWPKRRRLRRRRKRVRGGRREKERLYFNLKFSGFPFSMSVFFKNYLLGNARFLLPCPVEFIPFCVGTRRPASSWPFCSLLLYSFDVLCSTCPECKQFISLRVSWGKIARKEGGNKRKSGFWSSGWWLLLTWRWFYGLWWLSSWSWRRLFVLGSLIRGMVSESLCYS